MRKISESIKEKCNNEILENELLCFLDACKKEKKGIIFVYHPSAYTQEYHFGVNPSIALSVKQYIALQDVFTSDVDYKVVPLLLSDGYFYKKLQKESVLKIERPLISKEEDINVLISLCRKEGYKNIWILHPSGYSSLAEELVKRIPEKDEVKLVEEPLEFKDEKIHVVVLLMSEGQHYHDLIERIPEGVSVSKILPKEEKIKEWMLEKLK